MKPQAQESRRCGRASLNARGWKTASKAPVKNEDLWRALDAEAARHQIKWLWVKGHAGHVENERADALARRGVEAVRKTGRVVESEEAAGVKA